MHRICFTARDTTALGSPTTHQESVMAMAGSHAETKDCGVETLWRGRRMHRAIQRDGAPIERPKNKTRESSPGSEEGHRARRENRKSWESRRGK